MLLEKRISGSQHHSFAGIQIVALYWRVRINDPDLYEGLEYRYNVMKQRRQVIAVST